MVLSTTRYLYWLPEGEPGCEQLQLSGDAEGVRAFGLILRGRGEEHFRCRYELEADADWQFRRLAISVTGEPAAPRRREITRDTGGGWQVDGVAAPELEGCSEVDIQVTPFTNTLPIRRLKLAEGESAELRVAYVPVPELEPRPAEQRYTCLEALGAGGGRYLYEGLFRAFQAELPVDRDGLVIDYPETFRRQWPQ